MTSHARGKRFTQSTCLGILLAVLSYSGQADGIAFKTFARSPDVYIAPRGYCFWATTKARDIHQPHRRYLAAELA